MNKDRELFLLARLNTMQAITMQLAVVMARIFQAKGTDLLGGMHQKLREQMRFRARVRKTDDTTDAIAMQTMMLQALDEFFQEAQAAADTEKTKSAPPRDS